MLFLKNSTLNDVFVEKNRVFRFLKNSTILSSWVDNAVIIASEFGLSEKIIGLTVIAIGTSLPELITSIIAIRKGHSDVGIGNIIGSNIYNILMIMGVGAALGGVLTTSDIYVDYAIMIIFSLSLLIGLKTKIINRTIGVILATGYVLYLVTAFFK